MSLNKLSERKIEIDGKEYTLFLNRNGIVAWEKFSADEQKKIIEMQKKFENVVKSNNEINEETNPFAGIEDLEKDLDNFDESDKMLEKLYWIMLYTNHKLSLNKVHELFIKAKKEYGFEQLELLSEQMIEDINTNPNESSETKKLEALNQTN